MYKQLIESKKTEFEKAINHLKEELTTIRTGRANASLVENIQVECYGSHQPIKNLASITIPEARTITIQLWDRGVISDVEKALVAANLGMQPVNDGANLRLNLPSLNEERRAELAKQVRQLGETTRVRVRNIREEIWKEIGKLIKEKKLTEDQKYEAEEQLKKIVERYNSDIKTAVEQKEKEVMTV